MPKSSLYVSETSPWRLEFLVTGARTCVNEQHENSVCRSANRDMQFVVVMVTPIGLNNIGGNFFWIWGITCFMFIPLTYFFGVEVSQIVRSVMKSSLEPCTDDRKTSGRTLEQVDRMFYDEPRILMGLNPNHRKVIRASKEDEENRFRALAKVGERAGSVAEFERRGSIQEYQTLEAGEK